MTTGRLPLDTPAGQVLPEYQGAGAFLWLLYPEARYPLPALQAFLDYVVRYPWSPRGPAQG